MMNDIPNDYFRSLQFMFNTDDVEHIYNLNGVYIFEVDSEYLVSINEVGDDGWTMKVLTSRE